MVNQRGQKRYYLTLCGRISYLLGDVHFQVLHPGTRQSSESAAGLVLITIM